MGHSVTIIATSSLSPHDLCRRLGMFPAMAGSLVPETYSVDQQSYGPTLFVQDNGWTIVMMDFYGGNGLVAQASALDSLSKDTTVVAYDQMDSLNFSAIASWSNGKNDWTVLRDPEAHDWDHVHTTGALPDWYADLHAQVRANTDDYDTLGDLTNLMLSQACGFDFDLSDDVSNVKIVDEFKVATYVNATPLKKPWWKFWA